MALWTKKKITGIVPAKLEKVPLFVLLILQFNIYVSPKLLSSVHRENENDHRLGPRPVAMMGSLLAAVGSFIFVMFGIL